MKKKIKLRMERQIDFCKSCLNVSIVIPIFLSGKKTEIMLQ